MHTKNYEAIAYALHDYARPHMTRLEFFTLVDILAQYFAAENAAFKRETFCTACNHGNPTVKPGWAQVDTQPGEMPTVYPNR